MFCLIVFSGFDMNFIKVACFNNAKFFVNLHSEEHKVLR